MDHNCQKILKDELVLRKARNSAYSLRAFSRDLGIGLTSVSDCIAGKRNLSKTNIEKLGTALQLSPLEIEGLLKSNRKGATAKGSEEKVRHLMLAEDSFRLISNWYYLAILNLSKVKEHEATATWIADRLGISELEAQTALDRLIHMEFIELKNSRIFRTTKSLSTIDDVSSTAVRKFHADTLNKAIHALYDVPMDKREIISTTMAIDSSKIKEIKKILHGTLDKVENVLESDEADEIYNFSMQLFPLTQTDGK